MNNTIFIWLLFIPLLALGQTDTTTYKNVNGVFYEVKTVAEETQLGDTAQLVEKFVLLAQNESSRFANDISIVSRYSADLTKLIRSAEALQQIIGINPLDSVPGLSLFFLNGWNIGSIGIKFRYKEPGVTQWRADTSTQWRRCFFLNSCIRLNGFDGRNLDFWKTKKGYTPLGGTIIITEPGQLKPRLGRLPIDNSDEEAITLVYPAGVIQQGSRYWKYDTRKKAWIKVSVPTTQPIQLK